MSKKKKKRNLPPGITKEQIEQDFRKTIDGLLEIFQPRVALLSYNQMRDMCVGFIETLRFTCCDVEREREMIHVAGQEVIGILKDKYNLEPSDSAVLLLTMGMGMLKELDRQHDKRERIK